MLRQRQAVMANMLMLLADLIFIIVLERWGTYLVLVPTRLFTFPIIWVTMVLLRWQFSISDKTTDTQISRSSRILSAVNNALLLIVDSFVIMGLRDVYDYMCGFRTTWNIIAWTVVAARIYLAYFLYKKDC